MPQSSGAARRAAAQPRRPGPSPPREPQGPRPQGTPPRATPPHEAPPAAAGGELRSPRQLNASITRAAVWSRRALLAEVGASLRDGAGGWDLCNVATALHRGAVLLPPALLGALCDEAERALAAGGGQLSPLNVSSALYGLHHLNAGAAGDDYSGRPQWQQQHGDDSAQGAALARLLRALCGCLQHCPSLLPRHLGSALYGLHSLPQATAVQAAGRAVVGILVPHIAAAVELDTRQVCNALYGLRALGASPETRAALLALAARLTAAGDPPLPQELGSAAHGLQRHGGSLEARAVIAALTPFLGGAQLQQQTVGMLLYGTTTAGGTPERRQLAAALARRELPALGSQGAGNAIYGLCEEPDSPECRALLVAAERSLPGAFDTAHAGPALYGLRLMGPSGEARAVVAAVAAARWEGPWTEHAVNSAAYGIGAAGIAGTDAGRVCLSRVAEGLLRCGTPSGRVSPQTVATALWALRELGGGPEARSILAAAVHRLARDPAPLPDVELSAMLFGLCQQPDSELVRRVLTIAAERGSRRPAGSRVVGNTLYGLGMQPQTAAARAVVAAITARIPPPPPAMEPRHASNALWGLRGQHGSPEAMQCVAAITPHLQQTPLRFGEQAVANSLQALQRLGQHPAVSEAMVVLMRRSEEDADSAGAHHLRAGSAGGTEAGPRIARPASDMLPPAPRLPE
eukprot:TRINITY_DN15228_c1_g1_i1.p2 TRINITY_DN15228_c1_g1~~TRINITY_DN15228_c1_g1_i1.p2  ORF type:complete len:708 (+),score=218.34 TRINITY_DN15228_c1_g1_i1:60-2126(+)